MHKGYLNGAVSEVGYEIGEGENLENNKEYHGTYKVEKQMYNTNLLCFLSCSCRGKNGRNYCADILPENYVKGTFCADNS